MRKSVWINLTACILVTGIAPTAAAQSGVLLGLQWGSSHRTLWIATEGDSAAVLAEGPSLLVPRSDGFWKVDVFAISDSYDTWTAAPASQWPSVLDRMQRAQEAARADTVEEDMMQCDSYDHDQLRFVGPNYVSLWHHGGEEGCPMGGPVLREWYRMRGLDSTTTWLPDALDASTAAELAEALEALRDSLKRSHFDSTWSEAELDRCYEEGNWGIRRKPGGWEVAGSIPPFVRMGCYGEQATLPVTPPEIATGPARAPVDLDAIRSAMPGVRDAVLSPNGDLVVALTRDSLYAARVIDGAIQPPTVARLVRSAEIVMEEWALGRHVGRWTRDVRTLLEPDEARERP